MVQMGTAVCAGLHPQAQGDVDLLTGLLSSTDRVIVLFDGANRSRSSHLHPFTPLERMEMLSTLFPEEIRSGRLLYNGLDIEPYDGRKQIEAVRLALARLNVQWDAPDLVGIVPLDRRKRRIERLLLGFKKSEATLTTTVELKSLYGRAAAGVPKAVRPFLKKWKETEAFHLLAKEAKFCAAYKKAWGRSPYPPTFVAADAVVECGGKLLLIKRANPPFQDLQALPGGFVDQDEPLFNTVLREASEETGIPEDLLRQYFVSTRTFDDPDRDPRGRFISKAFLFRIPEPAPTVVAGDDAKEAEWIPFRTLHPSMFAFDHWNIVCEMLDVTWNQDGFYEIPALNTCAC